jgi:8-oxo-dGTP pyrophosphatase MutT (NUDIX family)
MLLTMKNRGLYKGRWDLPGGRIEPNESILEALRREFAEETGYRIRVVENLGAYDFLLPNYPDQTSRFHHIALFYRVEAGKKMDFLPAGDQDSSGELWVDLDRIHEANSSPLVMAAKRILSSAHPLDLTEYEDWKVLD